MKWMLLLLCLSATAVAMGQKREQFISLHITNQHTAFPLAKFVSLFTKDFHPGFEAGFEFLWRKRATHQLFQSFRAGYFYHRFVQHAVPLYTQLGYRYTFSRRLSFQMAAGCGYLHSITDAAVLKTDGNGNYRSAKGIGRGQAVIALSMGPEVSFPIRKSNVSFSLRYTQQLQTPFIKSYVPLLPYNQIAIGAAVPLKLGAK